MSDDNRRWIWTRDGRVPINERPLNTLGISREERIRASIKEWSLTKADPCAYQEVYERAYRRAGLLSGSPEEFDTWLPVEKQSPKEGKGESD